MPFKSHNSNLLVPIIEILDYYRSTYDWYRYQLILMVLGTLKLRHKIRQISCSVYTQIDSNEKYFPSRSIPETSVEAFIKPYQGFLIHYLFI